MSARFVTKSVLSLALTLYSGTALAQALPASTDAGRLQSEIRQELSPSVITVPEDMGVTADVVAPQGVEKITFVLKQIKIEGASAIAESELAQAYADYLTKKISLKDIYVIANRITAIYRSHGYILSRAIVPEQQIRDGVVHLRIVEGFVSDYRITGDDLGTHKQITAYAKKLIGTGTLNAQTLERYLLLMNDLPGTRVRSVLVPSETVAGGADLNLIVEPVRFQGFASVDNFGNEYIGPLRLTLGGQVNSPFNSAGRLNGALLWAPHSNEMAYYNMGYNQYVGNEGTRIGAEAIYTKTDPSLPSALGGLLEPEGEAYIVSLQVNHPFIRSRNTNVNAGMSFDVTKNKTTYAPGLSAIETSDSQRVLRLNSTASYMDGLSGFNTASGSISRGLDVFGASQKGDSNLSRASGDAEFTKLNITLTRLQRLYGPFSAFIGMTGQYSANSLLASEEFGFGGSEYGRGYDYSEIVGDNGLAGKLELAYNQAVEKKYLNNYQIYVFYDLGKVWRRDAAAGQSSHDSGASTGLGGRLTFTPSIRGDAFVAKPLTRGSYSRGEDRENNIRFKFSLTSTF